jgi:hypothetical protein
MDAFTILCLEIASEYKRPETLRSDQSVSLE